MIHRILAVNGAHRFVFVLAEAVKEAELKADLHTRLLPQTNTRARMTSSAGELKI